MLREDFYEVLRWSVRETGLEAEVSFRSEHPVFAAHFPHRPIVPGACLLEMVKELAEQEMGCVLRITEVPNMKFVHSLTPMDKAVFSIEWNTSDKGLFRLKAAVSTAGSPAAKCTLFAQIVQKL